jgi:iron complex outermembrane receptor protein
MGYDARGKSPDPAVKNRPFTPRSAPLPKPHNPDLWAAKVMRWACHRSAINLPAVSVATCTAHSVFNQRNQRRQLRGEGGMRSQVARAVRDSLVVAAALSWPYSAMAQVVSGSPGAASSSSSDANVVLEEVVVTAQKRSERLQDVPISITALSGADLDSARFQGVAEALSTVPGVSMTGQNATSLIGGGGQVAIRGVTASASQLAGSSPIGYYVDSVPFGLVKSAIAPDMDAYDLQRVEVLRGPQGTLYGANSEGGLVRILTNDADLNSFDFKGRTSVSTTEGGGENYRADMALNAPLVDGILGARLVVGEASTSGWINSPDAEHINNAEQQNVRLKLNAQPMDNLSMGASVWHSQYTYGAPSIADPSNDAITATGPEPASVGYNAFGYKASYNAGPFSVESMTSYLNYSSSSEVDYSVAGLPEGPGADLFVALKSHVFSEELVANSTSSGPWRWTVGTLYRRGVDHFYEYIDNTAIFPEPLDFADTSESYAVFGQVSQRFLQNKLEWTLGGRYFHDNVSSNDAFPITPANAGQPLYYESGQFHHTTPRAVMSFYPNNDLTLYASYSQGFRSGFPQDAIVGLAAPSFPALKPDTLNNYEFGAKGTLFDRRISFDAAVYYLDWRNVQQELSVPFNGAQVNAFVNGTSASGPGAEFAISALPLPGLNIALTFGWNDLVMDSNVYSGGVLTFIKGQRLNLSPEYTAGASVQYTFRLGRSGFAGSFALSDNYTSELFTGLDANNNPVAGNPIQLSRASFSVKSPTQWTVTAYADNLNNCRGTPYVYVQSIPQWDASLQPRTYGVQLEYHYK